MTKPNAVSIIRNLLGVIDVLSDHETVMSPTIQQAIEFCQGGLTKTVPTKPGLYWASFAPYPTIEDPVPVLLRFYGEELRVLQIGYDLDSSPDQYYWGEEITRNPIASES